MTRPRPGDLSIAAHVNDCLGSFHEACESLARAEPHIKLKLSPETINDIFGRFRLFVGNIGAHRRGRRSLDYKLREASHIRDKVIGLLQSLQSALQDALDIITSQRISWEDLSYSESDSSDDESQSAGEATTELEQLASNMAGINTCLMRLSMSIRNPAPFDQFKESTNIDVTHYEAFDIDHVRNKFPLADNYLVLRLGKAISRRRQYLCYRKEHREKLEQGLEELQLQELDSIPSERIESTVASSIPLEAKASAFAMEMDKDDYHEETLSQTSYASSTTDTTRLRPPPMPKHGQDGNIFECPLCFRFTSVRQATAWYKHVYRDLQPYMCTFEDCEIPDRTYESRREWFHHELQAHRKWWECVNGCNMTFRSSHEFRIHLCRAHDDLAEDRVDDLIRNCGRKDAMDTEAECCICQRKLCSLTQLRHHLGKHHEELSLFALPSNVEEDKDRSGTEDDESDKEDDESDKEDDESDKQAAIRAMALRDLGGYGRREGYLYIFYHPHNSDFISIGCTLNVSRRLAQWERHCKYRFVEYNQQTRGDRVLIRNVSRVERLVSIELRDVQFLKNCAGCGKKHRQWFRTTPEHAAKVIKKYSDWMAKDPYQSFDGHSWKLSSQAEAELNSISNITYDIE